MLDYYAVQLALRAGVNSVSTDLNSSITHAEDAKNSAQKRVNELVNGTRNSSHTTTQLAEQAAMVAAAMEVVYLAYTSISAQLVKVKDQRLAYVKERESGTATFIIPANKEARDLSREEKTIKSFVEITTKKSAFSTYSGLHTATLQDDQNNFFYSILPFYRMSESLGQPQKSHTLLDKQRRDISLFLKATVLEFLSHIDYTFQQEWKITSFAQSVTQGNNYINDLRATRFITMSLANMLWNIQHPVDPETGFPLSLEDSIKLCNDVWLYLDKLLESFEGKTPPYLNLITRDRTRLISFIRKIYTYTNALKRAYEDAHMHEINIDEVTNSAHQALEIMDKSILNLIYKRRHPLTNQADDSAAESLVCLLNYLHDLFILNPNLIAFFTKSPKIDARTLVNDIPTTIMDALIIFCHMPKPVRVEFIATLQKGKLDSVLEFAVTLADFERLFIRPIEKINKKKLNSSMYNPKYPERTSLTAPLLIPFITLVIDNYDVEIDTFFIKQHIERLKQDNPGNLTLTGKEQIERINQLASKKTAEDYYHGTLAPFLDVSPKTTQALDELIRQQNRMTQVTKLLDSINELIQNYRNFLQEKAFQKFLLRCVHKIKEEYVSMGLQIDRLENDLSEDEQMPRDLKQILSQMTKDVTTRLDAFTSAATTFKRIVRAPDFPAQQKQLLNDKIKLINQQFVALFGEHSGFDTSHTETLNFITADSSTETSSADSAPISAADFSVRTMVATNKIIALSRLAHDCFNGLSPLSKYGYKGLLLGNLISQIDSKTHYTEAQFNRAIKELVSITASYRETYFFQASYANTRSAKILIQAIKDPALNAIMPIGDIIFDTTDINYTEQSETQIVQALEQLRAREHWQASAGHITALASF